MLVMVCAAIIIFQHLAWKGRVIKNDILVEGILDARYVLLNRENIDLIAVECLEQALKKIKATYVER